MFWSKMSKDLGTMVGDTGHVLKFVPSQEENRSITCQRASKREMQDFPSVSWHL